MNASQTTAAAARPGLPARVLIRRVHSYVGAFIAPSVLFFAFTGSLQLFSLHESHGAYQPPEIVERLGMLHKDQVFALKPKHVSVPAAPAPAPAPAVNAARHREPAVATYLLKWFFLSVALGLVASTCLGLWMGLAQSRKTRGTWAALAAGAIVPLVLTVFAG